MFKLTKISFILLLICTIEANKTIELLEKLINQQKEEFDYKLNIAIKVQEIYESRIEEIMKQINNQQSTIDNLKQNPVPIGFIYTQLPDQPEPMSLWPITEWVDVSSEYAGLFFRVEGGGSAAFGLPQEENSPRLTYVHRQDGARSNADLLPMKLYPGQWSPFFMTATGVRGSIETGRYTYLRFKISDGEVRPRNKAIRIWKRTN
jgi:hypothetical protein